MKKINLIFVILPMLFIGVANAATDNSCDDEKNEYINQRLALCSTHAYNIGKTSNPTSVDERQLMQDVVALKATIATQQMKKQYDFLDVTLKRFKVQLGKAILTAQAQAAGAPEGNSIGMGGSGGGSGSSNKSTATIENCSAFSRSERVVCLRRNNVKYATALADRNISSMREQVKRDARLIDANLGKESKYTIGSACDKICNARNDVDTEACFNKLSAGIDAIEDIERDNTRSVAPWSKN